MKTYTSVSATDTVNKITVNGPSLPWLHYWQSINQWLIETDKIMRGYKAPSPVVENNDRIIINEYDDI